MSQDDIFTRVQKIVKEQLEVELSEVKPVMALEEEFDIEIPDEAAEGITTVQACVDYINSQLAAPKA